MSKLGVNFYLDHAYTPFFLSPARPERITELGILPYGGAATWKSRIDEYITNEFLGMRARISEIV
eukprot:5948485-Pleurochrysis_carterae.AAC.2